MSYLDLKSETMQRPYTNGKYKHVEEVEEDFDESSCNSFVEHVQSLWRRPSLNEWTCTFMLFLFSSSIIAGKLYLNYDFLDFLDMFKFYETIPNLADKSIIESFNKYGWFINAVFSGLATTGISWYILYKDSNVPGVNPPSPFSPSKRSFPSDSPTLEMNYLVGGLIGVAMFLYKCL